MPPWNHRMVRRVPAEWSNMRHATVPATGPATNWLRKSQSRDPRTALLGLPSTMRSKEAIEEISLRSSAVVLALAGVFKLASAFGGSKILNEPDPLLGLRTGTLLCALGFSEIVISGFLFGRGRIVPKLILLAGLSTNFLIYHLGLWWTGAPKPCPCLGSLGGWAHLSTTQTELLTRALVGCLIATSYGPLLWLACRPKPCSPQILAPAS
jgi:hypothetical protein